MAKSFFDISTGRQDNALDNMDEMIDGLDLSDRTKDALREQWGAVKEIVDEVVDAAYEQGRKDGAEAAND